MDRREGAYCSKLEQEIESLKHRLDTALLVAKDHKKEIISLRERNESVVAQLREAEIDLLKQGE